MNSDPPRSSPPGDSEARRGMSAWWCVFGFAGALSVLLLWAYSSNRLAANTDARVFCPPIISMANEGDLGNPVWGPARYLSDGEAPVFNYHGMLFPVFTGSVVQPHSYPELVKVLAAYRALVPPAFIFILFLFFRDGGFFSTRLSPRQVLFVGLGSLLALMISLSLIDPGRPEDLATLWLLFFLPAVSLAGRAVFPYIAAVGLGVLGSITPLIGLIVAMIFSAALAAKEASAAKLLLRFAIMGMGAVAVHLALFWVYPISVAEWLKGFFAAARFATVHGADAWWFRQTAVGFLFSSFYVMGLLCLLAFVIRVRGDFSRKRLVAAILILAWCIGGYYTFWKFRYYNVSAIAPVFLICAGFFMVREGWPKMPLMVGTIRGLFIVLAGLGAIFSMNLGLSALTAPDYREILDEVRAKDPKARLFMSHDFLFIAESHPDQVGFPNRSELEPGNIYLISDASDPGMRAVGMPELEIVFEYEAGLPWSLMGRFGHRLYRGMEGALVAPSDP